MEKPPIDTLMERVERLERSYEALKTDLAGAAPPIRRPKWNLAWLCLVILLMSLDLTLIRMHLRLPPAMTGPGNVGVVVGAFNFIFAVAVGLIYGRTSRRLYWTVIAGVCILFGLSSFTASEVVFDWVSNNNARR